MGNFWHEEFSAQEHFGTGHLGTWTFWHSSTGAKTPVPNRPYCFARCRNIHVQKCSGAEMSMVLKIPRAESSHAKKSPH